MYPSFTTCFSGNLKKNNQYANIALSPNNTELENEITKFIFTVFVQKEEVCFLKYMFKRGPQSQLQPSSLTIPILLL